MIILVPPSRKSMHDAIAWCTESCLFSQSTQQVKSRDDVSDGHSKPLSRTGKRSEFIDNSIL